MRMRSGFTCLVLAARVGARPYCGPVVDCPEAIRTYAWGCCPQSTLLFGLPPLSYPPYLHVNADRTLPTASFVSDYFTLLTNWVDAHQSLEIRPTAELTAPLTLRAGAGCLSDRSCDVVLAQYNLAVNHDVEIKEAFAFTTPVLVERFVSIVHRTQASRGLWAWTEPFTESLWLATLGFVMATAGLSVALVLTAEDRAALDEAPSLSTYCALVAKAAYHATAATLGGEDDEWLTGWPSRLLRLGMLLMVLVLQATYVRLYCEPALRIIPRIVP